VGPFMMETMKGSWSLGAFAGKRARLERAPLLGVAPSLDVNGRCGIRLAPETAGHADAGVGLYGPRSAKAVH